jgi:uncharacterized protein (DUF2345 family)
VPCQQCWIEVQLLDDADNPVAGEPYWIKLPDGEVMEGSLNDEGFVRLAPIPCGICIVRFPKWDAASFTHMAACPPNKKDWIEIVLMDDNQQPVAGEPYSIQLPDGSIVEGKLGEDGRARHEGIQKGTCQVKFPRLETADFISHSAT